MGQAYALMHIQGSSCFYFRFLSCLPHRDPKLQTMIHRCWGVSRQPDKSRMGFRNLGCTNFSKFPYIFSSSAALLNNTSKASKGSAQKQMNIFLPFVEIIVLKPGRPADHWLLYFGGVTEEVFQPDYCLWREEFLSMRLTTCRDFISSELLESLSESPNSLKSK